MATALALLGVGTPAVPAAPAQAAATVVSIGGDLAIGGRVYPSIESVDSDVVGFGYQWFRDGVLVSQMRELVLDRTYLGSRLSLTLVEFHADRSRTTTPTPESEPLTRLSVYVTASSTEARVNGGLFQGGAVSTGSGTVDWNVEWFRDGVRAPASADGSTHAFVPTDAGHRLSARVSAVSQQSPYNVEATTPATPVIGQVDVTAELAGSQGAKPHDTIVLNADWHSLYPPLAGTVMPTLEATWWRDAVPMGLPAGTSAYEVSPLDLGHRISVRFTISGISSVVPYTSSMSSVGATMGGRAYTEDALAWDYASRSRDIFERLTDGSFRLVAADWPGGLPHLMEQLRYGGGWTAMTALASGGDLSGDGRADLVARRKDGVLLLYRSLGDGRLAPATVLGTGWNGMNRVLAAGDVDWDGRGDLLARRASDGALLLYPGTGTGRLLPGRVIGSGFGRAVELVSTEDFTGDGRADVYATWPDGTLRLYAARPGGSLSAGVTVGTGWSGITRLLDGGDADRDGRSDLYALDRAGVLWLYRGDGHGRLLPRVRLATNLQNPLGPQLY